MAIFKKIHQHKLRNKDCWGTENLHKWNQTIKSSQKGFLQKKVFFDG